METANTNDKVRIQSPDKVARILQKVEQSGLPLVIRALNVPGISVKCRASSRNESVLNKGFVVENISERGIEFLSKNSLGVFQIEFLLSSERVQFTSAISNLGLQTCAFRLPKFLERCERRGHGRLETNDIYRAFVLFKNTEIDSLDPLSPPVFAGTPIHSQFITVGDISLGGLGLVSRFPIIWKTLEIDDSPEEVQIFFPMSSPTPATISLLWKKTIKEDLLTVDAETRTIIRYKFGLKFLNPSEKLKDQVRHFMERLSLADAI